MKETIGSIWGLLKETVELWSSKNAFQLAGALAFYTLFSMAPLVIIVVTIAGAIFGESAARGEISQQLEEFVGPQGAEVVEEAVQRSRIEEAGLGPTLLGIGALLFGATTVFAQMQAALNQMWDVVARPSRSGILSFLATRLVSLGMVLIIGFLLLVSFLGTMVLTTVLRFADHWVPVPSAAASALQQGVTLVLITILFAMIFKVLPDVRLEWRDMWRGAFLTAVLFAVGQSLISLYLAQTAPDSTYGAAGSLVLVLMWVYYSSLILFFGAAFVRVSVRRRGDVIIPRRSAVKVRSETVEEPEELVA